MNIKVIKNGAVHTVAKHKYLGFLELYLTRCGQTGDISRGGNLTLKPVTCKTCLKEEVHCEKGASSSG